MNTEQLERMRNGTGFIAALDQSGGSTPKALRLYGIDDDRWSTEEQMFDLMHAMRSRMMMSPSFDGRRVLGAILFEMTMDRTVDGLPTCEFLWSRRSVVPFLKVDKGLADAVDGCQMMKPMPDLEALLDRAVSNGVFGTKMRSVVARAERAGIDAVVDQQFEVGSRILDAGLVPIIEPEVDITITDKADAEALLRDSILGHLSSADPARPVMLKLTIPEVDDFYRPLIEHPAVLRVVALSGGYSREVANERLSRNHGMIASFSRALTEGLNDAQSDEEFDRTLDASIEGIYRASVT